MKRENNLYTKLLILSYEIENNKYFEAIEKGFLTIVPVLFIGAIALVVMSFPISEFQNFLTTWCGGVIRVFLNGIYKATYGLLSLYLTISISMSLSRKLFRGKRYTQGLTVVLSMICMAESLGIANEDFSYEAFGNTGVFTAIIVSLLVPACFKKIQEMLYGDGVKDFMISDDVDNAMFKGGVIPFGVCLILFFLLNILMNSVTGFDNINDMFAAFFGFAFKSMGTNLASGLAFLLCSGLLWFVGIHGGNALELVSQNIFVPANTDPNVIMSKTFLDVFGLMGGCGATICMIIAILLFGRTKSHRNLAKVAVPTVLFNVNEIMVFGLPIIFNPIMLIPFILSPMVSVSIAYAAACLGFMPIPTTMIEWTTPVLLSGYALTGSISGLIVQVIGIVSGVAIYAPFVKLLERVEEKREEFLIGELEYELMDKIESGEPFLFSKLHHGNLNMSIALASALKNDIKNSDITIHYQPQVNRRGKMIGAEALLRWNYHGRKIMPPLVIAIANEHKLNDSLSLVILERCASDMQEVIRDNPGFKLSINMTAQQVNDRSYMREFMYKAEELEICNNLCIEITEESNMDIMNEIINNIRMLKEQGITFAMDDFSMGHTSIKYLKENLFDYVKLDGSLVNEIMNNERSEEIVYSIIQLGEKLQFSVIAEYVDQKTKLKALQELGCDYYQGFLFSPAVPSEEIKDKWTKVM